YVSIGDVHTTRPLEPGMHEQDTRFSGLKRECGLHEDWAAEDRAA
ncbi:phosphoadenosine phosphosulfate reductase, partial [Acinetobacter baumannii]